MNFWIRFSELCDRAGKKPNPVAKELGISSGSITNWKNGSVPKAEILMKVSNFFDVSVAYLLGESDNPRPDASDIDPNDISYALMSESQELTEEQKQEVLEFIRFKKKKAPRS